MPIIYETTAEIGDDGHIVFNIEKLSESELSEF